MASYSIRWKRSAEKELRGLDRGAIAGVLAAAEALAENPYPDGCRKLHGSQRLWRVRTGDYRVIYSVDSGVLCIEIVRVGHRQSVDRA